MNISEGIANTADVMSENKDICLIKTHITIIKGINAHTPATNAPKTLRIGDKNGFKVEFSLDGYGVVIIK